MRSEGFLRPTPAQNTILNELGMLRNSLNIALHVWHWIRHNPFSGLKLGLKANFIDRWLTDEEEQKLLEQAAGKVYGQLPDIILLDLHTGLSQEELLNLKLAQIDFLRRTLTTTRKKTRKKDKPTRTIPLNSIALNVLTRRAKLNSGSQYVFCNSVGNRIDSGRLKREFIRAVKESEIVHFRFHDLRHTFATRLVQKGVDLYKVSKLLGHSSVTVTERYAHHCPESLRSGVEILEERETAILEESMPPQKQTEGAVQAYHTFITPAVIKAGEGIYYSLN
jgi:integrase